MTEKRTVRTACRGCHGVCQVLVHMKGPRVLKVTGDPESPTSRGYVCPKGAAAPELLYHPDRLVYPLRRSGPRGGGSWERVSWEEALDEISSRFNRIKAESGSEYVAILQGTGRPLMNLSARFANAFGTPNFVSIAHICYAPRVAASVATMGRLPVTDIYGFKGCSPSCVVIWGCNVTKNGSADGLCGGMMKRALDKADRVIVIDPRRIGPVSKAKHWLQVRPGTDGALALAMINVMLAEDLYDHEFVERYTVGIDRLKEHVQPFTPQWAEGVTRVPASDIVAAVNTYAGFKPNCILWGNAIDMSRSNFQTARAVAILMGLTGSIDVPGGNVFWVPPSGVRQQSIFMNPEAMGSRFMPAENVDRALDAGLFGLNLPVRSHVFWRALQSGDPYRVRALWVLGANPLLTHTNPLSIQQGLKEQLEFTVVSDLFMTPTAQLADLVLPAASWLETDDVVNLHKIWCVLARKKVAQMGETRDDKEVIIQLARRLGLEEAFPWQDFRDYLEWVVEPAGISFAEFCDLGIVKGEMRYRKHEMEGFATVSGKFEFCLQAPEAFGVEPLPVYREPCLSPLASPEVHAEFPFILSAGRAARAFFHSEGRQIGSLRRRNPEPVVQIHPDAAEALGIHDNDWVWIETPGKRRIQQRAELFDGIALDNVNIQYGWWFPEESPPQFGWKRSNANLLFGEEAGYDPETGSESLRSSLCRVYPVHP